MICRYLTLPVCRKQCHCGNVFHSKSNLRNNRRFLFTHFRRSANSLYSHPQRYSRFFSFDNVSMCILTGLRNNVGLVEAFHAFSVRDVAFQRSRFLWMLHNDNGFLCVCVWAEKALTYFWTWRKTRSVRMFMRADCLHALTCVNGCFLPLAGELLVLSVCRGKVGESRWRAGGCELWTDLCCLLSALCILAQWAISTPRHSMLTGVQAELQSPPLSLCYSIYRSIFFV